ncbi:hypothetical protein HY605_04450 [Candidatus Peregrinibacteria bacterium]|nr:hypothetical protein [Candidatus Peregrinibacteria bacterium]
MRDILTISIPRDKKKTIKIRAQKMGKSISAYIAYVVELEQHLISEDQIKKMKIKAEKDYKQGKTKVLRSLADLT